MSNSLEVKCDECDDIFRNKATLAKHYEKSQVYICKICYEWEEISFRGVAEMAKHIFLIHEIRDETLPDQEFEDMSLDHQRQIINGLNNPKRVNLVKRKEEIKRKKDESEKN